jgi:hypothetical protein
MIFSLVNSAYCSKVLRFYCVPGKGIFSGSTYFEQKSDYARPFTLDRKHEIDFRAMIDRLHLGCS